MGTKTAKGSLSFINWGNETTYGTAPVSSGSNYWGVPFVSEGLDMSVNPIMSAEIRPDRTVPGVRGGNRAAGGPITTDFAIHRHAAWFQHLIGGGSFTTTTITPTALAAGTWVRGDYVTSNTKLYLCVIGGTESGTPALTHTSGEAQLAGGTKWQYVGADSVPVYRHVLTGSPTLPTGGISAEKGIVGGDANLYQMFTGGRMNSGRITIPQEGIIQSAWDILFTKSLPETTTPATVGVVVGDAPLAGHEAMLSLSGVENYDLRDGNFEINNNISGTDYRIGSRDRKAATEARRECRGQFTAYFTDLTMFSQFKNETVLGAIFSFYRSGNFLSLEFPECKFFGTPLPKIGGAGTVSSTFDIVAYKEQASYDVQLIIKTTKNAAAMQALGVIP
jgi:hypothetical protein